MLNIDAQCGGLNMLDPKQSVTIRCGFLGVGISLEEWCHWGPFKGSKAHVMARLCLPISLSLCFSLSLPACLPPCLPVDQDISSQPHTCFHAAVILAMMIMINPLKQ